MDLQYLEYEGREQIGIIRLNRPEVLNALNLGMILELGRLLEEIQREGKLRGVIITGNGRAFAAGADLSSKTDQQALSPTDAVIGNATCAQRVYSQIENFDLPVIAAVNGYALGGGCELAMCCDIRIASEKAVFGQPEVGLGVIACYGGTQRLPALVGMAKAKEILFTARKVDAKEALEIGLVNKVTSEELLMTEAIAMMERIAANAPIAVKYTKKCVNAGISEKNGIGMDLEKQYLAICSTTEDCMEGGRAFFEKRKPEFKNK